MSAALYRQAMEKVLSYLKGKGPKDARMRKARAEAERALAEIKVPVRKKRQTDPNVPIKVGGKLRCPRCRAKIEFYDNNPSLWWCPECDAK